MQVPLIPGSFMNHLVASNLAAPAPKTRQLYLEHILDSPLKNHTTWRLSIELVHLSPSQRRSLFTEVHLMDVNELLV